MKELPSNDRYILLAQKWLDGTITPDEEEEYARWYARLDEQDVLHIPADRALTKEEHRQKILQQINIRRKKVIPLRQRVWRVSVAAALLIAAGFGSYKLLHPGSNNLPPAAIAGNTNADVKPGTYGAVLTLSNGTQIVLDTARNGRLNLGTADAVKQGGNLLFANEGNDAPPTFYTLATPRARQQQLTLPDGTQVWLNAASAVKFPGSFTGNTREIELWGEAYLEVAQDPAKPFLVKSHNTTVEVLGTHFNMMAYDNEPSMQTTLLEGAVKVSNNTGKVLLRPGEQSELLANGTMRVNKQVNTDAIVAWKNGMQTFEQADLKTIMRNIERWYDVEISYRGEIPAQTFSGDIPRTANLSEVLKLFKASKINFEIDKNMKKIIVIP